MSVSIPQPIIAPVLTQEPVKFTQFRYPSLSTFKMPTSLPQTRQPPTKYTKLHYANLHTFKSPTLTPSVPKFTRLAKLFKPRTATLRIPLQPSHYALLTFVQLFFCQPFASQLACTLEPSLLAKLSLRPFTHPDLVKGAEALKKREDKDPRNIWFGIGDAQREKFQKIMSLSQEYERNIEDLGAEECRHLAWREVERDELDMCVDDTPDGVTNDQDLVGEMNDMKGKMVSFLDGDVEFKMRGMQATVEDDKEEDWVVV